jgi:ABC-type uncharacterized transport system fused permease/ATPase subunit
MQRAQARLIYHKPAFAILDECTSAVSGEMEVRLYKEICTKLKITYITISHRLVMTHIILGYDSPHLWL